MGTEVSTISQPHSKPLPAIEDTYKARELEGIVDLFFYRRIGFGLAKFFARLNLTPTAVTCMGGVFGVIAGHLYLYRDLAINLIGMVLHVIANVFDNADGQLARLTNRQSRTGRILDPVIDHIIWLSIYVHLALRLEPCGFPGAIWFLALTAGVSHGAQAAAADYWRNAYLYFGKGSDAFDSASTVKEEYRRCSWGANAWTKFLFGLYLCVAREQEFLLPGVNRLHGTIGRDFGGAVPPAFQARYTNLVRPTFKWWSLLMTNTRMLILFVLFLVRQPVWFFWLEITAGNLLLFTLVLHQEKISRSLVQFLTTQNKRA